MELLTVTRAGLRVVAIDDDTRAEPWELSSDRARPAVRRKRAPVLVDSHGASLWSELEVLAAVLH